MAGGQYALLAVVLVAVFAAGMLSQFVYDSLHCEHRHHVDTARSTTD